MSKIWQVFCKKRKQEQYSKETFESVKQLLKNWKAFCKVVESKEAFEGKNLPASGSLSGSGMQTGSGPMSLSGVPDRSRNMFLQLKGLSHKMDLTGEEAIFAIEAAGKSTFYNAKLYSTCD
jgi:hypothetical protein